MKIFCFGIAKDHLGGSMIVLPDLNDGINSVLELRNWIKTNYPDFKIISNCMIAVNQEYAEDDQAISENDEIAIIPPISGG